jgi:hypothetical protein
MKIYYKNVIEFFGIEWFQTEWEKFRNIHSNVHNNSFSSNLILHEISLHPLIADVFIDQNFENEQIDFNLIKPNSPSDFNLTHLGRDLDLLKTEINERGLLIKKDLLKPEEYESHRFTLMVAAGYKIEGYKVLFVPTSSEVKRADLLVSNNTVNFYIENKRINQQASDQQRYEYFADLVDNTLNLLRLRKYYNTVVGVDAKGDINNYSKIIENAIFRKIWRNQDLKETKNLAVKFSALKFNSELYLMLKRLGHFQKYPIYTRAEDFLIASDPVNKNVILLNKNVLPDEIPSRVLALLGDANSKIKDDKKLIVYFDIGRGMSSWISNISDFLVSTVNNSRDDIFPNIDAFVLSQASLKHIGGIVQIRPNFNIIGNTKKLGGNPEVYNLFGFQGHTGMDNYLIKEFLNPVPVSSEPGQKYIECKNCGNRVIGLATNFREGELFSQMRLKCDKCFEEMDMTIKIT